ncbi:DUF86 domain-containing protein [candidate division KSB1 bacterium]|nr:DUF86 domain-containing protein [candidate division KSB1 bacterium]
MNDIVLNKKESIERCIKQIRAYYESPSETDFKKDFFKQDAIAINLQRACEQCIDLANHAIKSRKLGLPKGSKESFLLLSENKIIPKVLSTNMEKMVGFRNTLVHQYQQLDTDLMMDVIENHLDDLLDFTNMIAQEFAE